MHNPIEGVVGFVIATKLYQSKWQVRSQAEAIKPGLQHKFGNLTLFSPQTC